MREPKAKTTVPKMASLPHLVAVEPLAPYARNSRTHSPEQIKQIEDSIRRFGFVGVLGYDADGLAIGHGRRLAALNMWARGEVVPGPGKREPIPEGFLPAIDITGLSEAERRALIIADNQLALNADWDREILSSEMAALSAMDFEMPLLGFDPKELDKLLGSGAGAGDPDDVPEPAEPISIAGDLWTLGDHLLLCGDATEFDQVWKVLGEEGAVLTLTDPPYGIGYEYRDHDDTSNEQNADLVDRVFEHAPPAKVWTPGSNNLARDISRFGKARMVIWYKKFAAAGSGLGGASTIEPILVLDPPVKALANDLIEIGTDREKLGDQMLREFHPCPKPVALYERLLDAFTSRGMAVYEPFSGSGTTMMACERQGRRCRGIEIDPVYVDVAIRRWEQWTGREAMLGDQSFAQISEARKAIAA